MLPLADITLMLPPFRIRHTPYYYVIIDVMMLAMLEDISFSLYFRYFCRYAAIATMLLRDAAIAAIFFRALLLILILAAIIITLPPPAPCRFFMLAPLFERDGARFTLFRFSLSIITPC